MRELVRQGYAAIANVGLFTTSAHQDEQAGMQKPAQSGGCCGPSAGGGGGGCCGGSTLTAEQVAFAVGYAGEDLHALPEGANMGLSCGNPTAIAALKVGEVVVDLGSGGGFDCFLAGPKVGASGRVIGVDMTPEMLSKARQNVETYAARSGLRNVEFRLGEIENLPLADASADVVISNCVLNLSPDKERVWKEIARVLKPGGRVAVSDLALVQPLPAEVVADVAALVGCVAGAVLVEETREQMMAAGLREIVLTAKPEYVKAMTDWQDPLYKKIASSLPAGKTISDYVTSLDIAARK
ncbi:MAG: arsenite methyltransferase [Planctomycetes bacterium]|nr:arsenite methyltransferase [Planctomycetota bacterium]